jgi:ubiquinone/menaquinone biosynthesis C-methylase UbiE
MENLEHYKFEKNERLFFLKQMVQKHGMKGLYKQFRPHEKRAWSRTIIDRYSPKGNGLEIGCGEQTIAPVSRTVLSDGHRDHAGNKSIAKVFFKGDNIPYEDSSFSFVLNEHVLEHIYNPIEAILEWGRVLKKEGSLILFLPHKERTFDKLRKRTTLTELLSREESPSETKNSILQEWTELVMDKGLASHYNSFTPRELLETGQIHYNVWLPEDIVELLNHLGLEILFQEDYVVDRPDSFLVIAKKNR